MSNEREYSDSEIVGIVTARLKKRLDEAAELMKTIERLKHALRESVKLQGHYAELLNAHDGGERIPFRNPSEWLRRLESGGFEDELADVDLHREREGEDMTLPLVSALHLVLRFHSSSPWTHEDTLKWKQITGDDGATTKSLCDYVRKVLGVTDGD